MTKLARGIRNVDLAEHLGFIGFHKAAVIVAFDAFDERRLVQRAAVYDSGNIVCQLQRRKAVIRLTDRCVQIIAALPLADRRVGLALLLTIGRACCLTGGFADLDAGRRAETELLSPLLEVLTGQLLTDRVEERIARVFERIRDVERHGRVVVVAAEGLSAVFVGAGAGNVGVTGDDAFLQTRDGGHHLKGGAGGYTPEVARFTSGWRLSAWIEA